MVMDRRTPHFGEVAAFSTYDRIINYNMSIPRGEDLFYIEPIESKYYLDD